MPAINRQWFEHLAPKLMHRRLREIDSLLQQWCATDYGRFWLTSALHPQGLIRVRPGQMPPFLNIIAMEGRSLFVAPQSNVREGHRGTGQRDAFQSGRPLDDGELALTPTIRIDTVTDRALLAAAARGDINLPTAAIVDPSTVFSAPAHLLLAPTAYPKKSFVLYQHIFGEGGSYPDDGYFYVGVTTRSWQARWAEHRRAVERGSPLLFHRKLSEELEAKRVSYIHHKVMGVTDDVEVLYATEESLVEEHWKDDRRLNMIPGGKSGLRYLRENGMLADRVIPMPDERDRILAEWMRDHPRKGLPAPWVAERWKDDDWAIAQICGREGRLSVEQVRAIRTLAVGHSPTEIALRIGAQNVAQVERVLDGKTYGRVL
jgi:hypothetical protein